MRRMKLPTLALAVLAVAALALPAIASASQIESSPGVLTPIGTTLRFGSENFEITGDEKQSCSHVVNYAALIQNDVKGSAIVEVLGNNGENNPAQCNEGVQPHKINNFWVKKFFTNLTGHGEMTLSFTGQFGSAPCEWHGTVPFTYVSGSHSVTITKGLVAATPAGCGSRHITAEIGIERVETVGSKRSYFPVILN